MHKIALAILMLVALPARADNYCVDASPGWSSDFSIFMRLMDCTSHELTSSHDRAAYLMTLSDSMVGVEVKWAGTLRQILDKPMYAVIESVAQVGPKVTAARVIYHSTLVESHDWKQHIGDGKPMQYLGIVSAVKVSSMKTPTPALYIEVLSPGMFKERNSANDGLEPTR